MKKLGSYDYIIFSLKDYHVTKKHLGYYWRLIHTLLANTGWGKQISKARTSLKGAPMILSWDKAQHSKQSLGSLV